MSSNQSRRAWHLVADIGGTNARFARKEVGSNHLLDMLSINVNDHENFSQALIHVLELMGRDDQWQAEQKAACFALASRVDHDEIRFLNSHWHFSRAELNTILGSVPLELINDFAAKGYGIPELTSADWQQVGGGDAVNHKPLAILGPGTGLGVSLLIPAADSFSVVDGEGGHVDFAPLDEMEFQVLEVLREKYGRVSVERLLSGAGIINIYQALARIRGESATLQTAEAISLHGQRGDEALAEESLRFFCRVLGSVAGNLALTAGALGGVYITGVIVPSMQNFFAGSEFRQRFEAKGRFTDYLARIPVRVVNRHDLGLLGAANKLTLSGY